MVKRNMVRQVRDEPRAHRWDKKRCNGSENDPKTGADETLRNFIVARDTRSTLGPGTKRTASWETQETSDACTSPTTSPRRPDGRQIKQFKRQHIFVIINASSGRNSEARECSSFKLRPIPEVNSRQRWGRMFLLYLPRVCCRQRLRKLIPGRLHRPSEQLNL